MRAPARGAARRSSVGERALMLMERHADGEHTMSAGANNNRGNERLRRLSLQLVGANCPPAMGTIQSALATVPAREQVERERIATVGHSAAAALPSPSETAAPGLHGLSAVERYYFETQGFVVVPDIIPKELLEKLNAVSC